MALLYVYIFGFLLIIGTPIVFVMLLAPGATLLIEGDLRFLNMLVQRLFAGMDSFPLMALPFFILAGELMTAGGITTRIVRFAETFVAHRKAGLGQVSVSSSIMLAGGSGSAVADASALGGVMIPGMHQAGYTRSFSAAITAASAVLASIIPPSGLMILYAFIMNVSVAAMFAAAIIPGLIIGFGLMIVVAIVARFRSFPDPAERATWGDVARESKRAILPLLTPIILIGGIVGGVFTPTEGAAVAAFYALILGVLITREIRLTDLPRLFGNAALRSAVILLLVGAAVSFASLVSLKGTPQLVSGLVLGITDDPLLLFFVIVALLLAVGTIMDAGPAILILGPILAPVMINLGIHPIHFAVVMCIVLIIGLITPPLGLVLFVVSGISGERIERISWDLIPYFLFEVAVVGALILFPELVLWLPRVLGYV